MPPGVATRVPDAAAPADGRPRRRRVTLRRVRQGMSPAEWRRAGAMAGAVVALHVIGFVLLFAALPHHFHIDKVRTFGIGTGLLAYTLGMRHAFDA
ncbi:MAG TPA: hypothetical protein VKR22_13730, partial [Acidimicrobiales bacterium]|nr:hypothetical protein [Acidimicrobiales bacterium]